METNYPVMVHAVCVVTEQGRLMHCTAGLKDNSVFVKSLTYLHINYLWLP